MPAAAVIPALIAYTKVVAVKKLVVGFWGEKAGRPIGLYRQFRSSFWEPAHLIVCTGRRSFTLKKLECSKQAIA